MTTRALIIESLRTAVIMGTGDILAQTVVEKKKIEEVNVVRVAKFSALGMLLIGPVLKTWYPYLDRVIKGKSTLHRSVKKMLVDQTVMAPLLTLSVTGIVAAFNNEDVDQIKERIRTQYPDILLKNYYCWPVVQIANFAVVPLQYQVVVVNIVAVFWNCFLSQALNDKKIVSVKQRAEDRNKNLSQFTVK